MSTRKPVKQVQQVKQNVTVRKVRKPEEKVKKDEKPKARVAPQGPKTVTEAKPKPTPHSSRMDQKPRDTKPRTKTRSPLNSSRVVKSKFFPTKSMYSSALQSKTSSPERPRTATLRKGSIVNMNIAGPDIPIAHNAEDTNDPVETETLEETKEPKNTKESENTIEPENTNDSAKTKEELEEAEANYEDDFDSYNSDFEAFESSSSASSLPSPIETESSDSEEPTKPQSEDEKKLDSGTFDLPEEAKHKPSLDDIVEAKTNPASLSDEGFEDTKSLQFVNFLDAKKKQQKQKAECRKSRRGEELMSMIRLDHQNFTLFELAPISYETFIKSFGSKNCVQASSQTGDDCVDEEVQTDRIPCANKWTQFPNKFAQFEDLAKYSEDIRGCGGDGDATGNRSVDVSFSEFKLSKFLRKTLPDILQLLRRHETGEEFKENLGFSESYRKLNLGSLPPVAWLGFGEDGQLFTVHDYNEEDLKTVCCAWQAGEVAEVFGKYGSVSCANSFDSKLFFAGSDDGSVAVWDLSQVRDDVTLKLPNYTSPASLDTCSRVNAIKTYRSDVNEEDFASSTQIAALYENGFLLIFGVIYKPKVGISLVKNVTVPLNVLQCLSMVTEGTAIYVTTNQGQILHCTPSGVSKTLSIGSVSAIACLEVHPHCSDYFLAGFDGTVSLFSKLQRKPLMVLQDDEDMKVRRVQWSWNKPCSFYVLCNDDLITTWDLAISDLVPIETTAYGTPINLMRVHRNFMVVATNDAVKIHILKEDRSRFDEELKMFRNYLKRL